MSRQTTIQPKSPARAAKSPATKPAAGKIARRTKASAAPYHHGALQEALLTAAERILERDGLPGLTLRAAAREAGVSHAAPTHHFGDLTGLLSELAAVGFRRFREALLAAADRQTAPGARLDAMGSAYVSFAKTYPGMFTLMFRSERLDPTRSALAEAMEAAGAALGQAVGAQRQETIVKQAPTLQQAARMVRAWSMVHGFAVLLLDGRLGEFLAHLPPGESDATLLEAILSPGSEF
ncbi:TetR/AcrR family transcriptional regulator [Bradyrhizobium prioriisuperbiae]|uniref:TetR/AcrR family transcriptional regulator n=1 Tax=Bradyrhizobium prioriisuperbiae TaxID=2854389 RepID=UPI0028E3ACB7|nr:TetR/AcrR family transcriptional regulator [Bradyrhizobium prioritasuperba]